VTDAHAQGPHPPEGTLGLRAGPDWDAVLDDFAERLAAQRRAISVRRPADVPDFVPPEGLGPLPARLQERARKLVAESEGVTAALEAALARVENELASLERSARTQAPTIPSFIDQRA
jgi:hypothetical protein